MTHKRQWCKECLWSYAVYILHNCIWKPSMWSMWSQKNKRTTFCSHLHNTCAQKIIVELFQNNCWWMINGFMGGQMSTEFAPLVLMSPGQWKSTSSIILVITYLLCSLLTNSLFPVAPKQVPYLWGLVLTLLKIKTHSSLLLPQFLRVSWRFNREWLITKD